MVLTDVVIPREHRSFFVSERDEVFCYAGICLNEEDAIRRGLFVHPYYMDGRHSTDKKIAAFIWMNMLTAGFMGIEALSGWMSVCGCRAQTLLEAYAKVAKVLLSRE